MIPSLVVIHYSGSGTAAGTIDHLCDPNSGKSAHLVIDRDGYITQLVAFDIPAWHAGQSVWNGRKNVNDFSIGIELINWGQLTRELSFATSQYKTWTNKVVPLAEVTGISTNEQPRTTYWHNWPEPQIRALYNVLACLVGTYPSLGNIDSIVGHYDVSPGRKPDPGLAFPMAAVKQAAKSILHPNPKNALKPGTSGNPEVPEKIVRMLTPLMTHDELFEWYRTPNPFIYGKPPKDMPVSWLLVNLACIASFLGKLVKD